MSATPHRLHKAYQNRKGSRKKRRLKYFPQFCLGGLNWLEAKLYVTQKPDEASMWICLKPINARPAGIDSKRALASIEC
jgi:hypothetical protein